MAYVWQEVQCAGAKPLARSSHSVDVIKGSVYVMGGEHEPRVPIGSRVWCLNMGDKVWREVSTTGDVPSSRNAHASAVVDSSIYIFGGRQGVAMDEGSLCDLYRLDTVDGTWTKVPMSGTVPEARSYHAMTAMGSTLYVFGGCSQTGRLNDLHAFDTLTGMWRSFPTCSDILGRGGAGFTAVGNKLYVIGGFAGKEVGDVHEFDPECSTWRQIHATPPLPPRSVFGVASLGEKIFVIGGEVDPSSAGHAGAGQFSDEVYVLDTRDEKGGWQKMKAQGKECLPPRGWFAASAFSQDSIFLFGGNSGDNCRLDDSFLLQLKASDDSWLSQQKASS